MYCFRAWFFPSAGFVPVEFSEVPNVALNVRSRHIFLFLDGSNPTLSEIPELSKPPVYLRFALESMQMIDLIL